MEFKARNFVGPQSLTILGSGSDGPLTQFSIIVHFLQPIYKYIRGDQYMLVLFFFYMYISSFLRQCCSNFEV